MRIDSFSQIQQLYGMSKPATSVAGKSGSDFRDKLNISNAGKDLNVAKQAVNSASDVRKDRVAELKAAIDSGSYDVSGEDFADRIMEKLSQTLA